MLTAQVELAPGYLDMDDPKVLSALGSISCGDNLAAVQYQLIVEDCAGMTRSYYSSKTTLRHLTQGCAFHTTMPDGSEYVVKRVFARPPTEDGRPKFIDRSRLGVLRANGMVEASSTSPVVTFADVPIDCPPIR